MSKYKYIESKQTTPTIEVQCPHCFTINRIPYKPKLICKVCKKKTNLAFYKNEYKYKGKNKVENELNLIERVETLFSFISNKIKRNF